MASTTLEISRLRSAPLEMTAHCCTDFSITTLERQAQRPANACTITSVFSRIMPMYVSPAVSSAPIASE